MQQLDALIGTYVQHDATAFCTYAEYQTAIATFIRLGNLRAASVQGQLDGTVPATTEAQNANPDRLIAAAGLDLTELGSMMAGARGNGLPEASEEQGFSPLTAPSGHRGGQQQRPTGIGAVAQPTLFNNLLLVGLTLVVLLAAIYFVARQRKNY